VAVGTWRKLPIVGLAAGTRALFSLPERARRAIAGKPIVVEGQQLDVDMQLLLRLQRWTGRGLEHTTAEHARREVAEGDAIIRGPLVRPVATRTLPLPAERAARLYVPEERAPGRGLLIYYHGGGWTVGDLDSHDNVCRFLAKQAGVSVLSADYRLAPEHRFPAAAHDVFAAFRWTVAHADELGIDPDAIAVGGDSAGGNLAIVSALQAVEAGGPRPAYQLLFYPATDLTARRPSRQRYAERFFLTEETMNWYEANYAHGADKSDRLLSPMLAPDLSGMPPAYLATAGFDPLRDEGEAFGSRLAEAGVPVTRRRFEDLIHGYVNFFGFSRRAREALGDAALALHQAIGVRAKDRT
jgi:acetyl esterase